MKGPISIIHPKPFFLVITFFLFIWIPARSQDLDWIGGFSQLIYGETIGYHCAIKGMHMGMLVRSQDSTKYVEWETESIPADYSGDMVEFAWLANIDSRTQPRSFKMYINGEPWFTFQSGKERAWTKSGPNQSSLRFETAMLDRHGDYSGYQYLRIPVSYLEKGKPVRIRVHGESADALTWYMPMMYEMGPNIVVRGMPTVIQKSNGLQQQIKFDITHFGKPQPLKLEIPGIAQVDDTLHKGRMSYYLPVMAPKEETSYTVRVYLNGILQGEQEVSLKPVRPFEVYLLPHSHIDIGYTHPQAEVEQKQWENFELGISLAEKTAEYPPGAQFKWNAEVFWAVDSYLRQASEEKRAKFLSAVNQGWIGLDALYASNLTGLMRPEELMLYCGENVSKLYDEYGLSLNSAMISDVPGAIWGLVPAMAHNGIKYFSSGPNHITGLPHAGDRVGYTLETWGDMPFWWESPSGKQKVLSWMSVHGYSWFHPMISNSIMDEGSDIQPVLDYLAELTEAGYPYDMLYLRYTMGGDNGPPDPGLPEFVKTWNETYAYPTFRIATTSEVFEIFEKKYGDSLPVYKGDFTPYWEDGAGSTAKETGLVRNAAEKLNQLSTLYSINQNLIYPVSAFREAWKNVLLFNEHTWGAWNSVSDPHSAFVKDLWQVKQNMALDAEDQTRRLVDQAMELDSLSESIQAIEVYNTSSWTRKGLVTIPPSWDLKGHVIVDAQENFVPVQLLANGSLVFIAKEVPPLGSKIYRIRAGELQPFSPQPRKNRLANDRISLQISEETGQIYLLRDHELNRELVDVSSGFGLNHYIYTGQNAANPRSNGLTDLELIEDGPVLQSITVHSSAPGCTDMIRKITLINDINWVEISNYLEKNNVFEKENVRFAFPFKVPEGKMIVDLAWGVMEPEKDQLKGSNKNFFSVQRWIDISDEKGGILWANIDAPLVEIGGMYGEAWMSEPHRPWIRKHKPSQHVYSWVMNNSWHTNYKASQSGNITTRYTLVPHGDLSITDRKKLGMEIHQPLIVLPATPDTSPKIPHFNLEGTESVVVTSIRPGKEPRSIIVRLFNAHDVEATTTISCKNPVLEWWLSDPHDKDIEKVAGEIRLAPWEIVTLKAKF